MYNIDQLETRVIKQIELLQDFQIFTGFSYDRYHKMVIAGNLQGSVTNVRTNNILSDDALAKVLLTYLDNDLPKVVIYQLISYFDAFYDDFFEVLNIKRHKKKDMFKEFIAIRKAINIETISIDDEKRLIELRASRHALAHSGGIADNKYIQRAGSFVRAKLGYPLVFSRPYVYDSADFLKDLVKKLVLASKVEI